MKEDFSNNELEKRLREAAEKFALPPSGKVWEGISSQLHPRRKRRPLLWLVAAAVLLALLLGTYFILQQKEGNFHHNTPVTTVSPGTSGKSEHRVKTETNHQRKVKERDHTEPGTIVSIPTENIRSADVFLVRDRQLSFLSPVKMTIQLPESVQAEMAEMPPPLLKIRTEIAPFVPTDANTAPVEDKGTGKRKNKKRQVSYEAFFTSGIGYRTLDVTSSHSGSGQMFNTGSQQMFNLLATVQRKEKMEQHPDWSYSAGLRIVFPMGKQYSLLTGLSITQLGYRIRAYGTYPAYVRNDGSATVSGYTNANSVYTQDMVIAPAQKPGYIHNRYLTMEIPVLAARDFGSPEKLHFRLGLGGGLFYMMRSAPVIYSPGSARYFTDKNLLRPLNGNFHLEGDMIIPLSEKFNFTIGPSLQYQILSSYKNYSKVAEHPYFMGIKAGLQWKK